MAEILRLERATDRVTATLDRPEARNAIDQAMIDALHALCAELEEDPRILILAGAGGIFASGADIAQLRDRRADDARAGINTTAFRRIRQLPMPVIAAVDGYALGGGAELAYAADIRIGTPRTRIGNPETGLGIIAAAGATWRLPQIVGEARAAELLFTG
ncbi:MAG: enoyl-CoA hydratase/isomerase family protein, partial [Actinobacteria bacterium]|nr:enoyl-CoA hydratase/isomerase family protein [Actinomycetota bacterium]